MTTTLTDDRRTRRRLNPKLAVLAALVLIAAVITAFIAAGQERNAAPLDPDNPSPEGARAVAQVLGRQGVQVTTVRSAADLPTVGSNTTVVVTNPNLLGSDRLDTLKERSSAADTVVLVGAGQRVLDALGLPVDVTTTSADQDKPASCALAAANGLTLPEDTREVRYTPRSDPGDDGASRATRCFPPAGSFSAGGDEAATLVSLPSSDGGPTYQLLGSSAVLRNNSITDGDRAALALRLLGAEPTLIWWNANSADAGLDAAQPARWPQWLAPAALIVALAAVVLMLVRGRRLGALVSEPLPVIVRADETTRARGQLYRRAGDLGRGAAVLRAGTERRLASYLNTRGNPDATIRAVADATGRPAAQVADLLLGPAPTTESGLTSLAQQLSALEKEVRPQ
ncbi:DUF4350 domain-containing protein [Dermacoccaceae bacterium W4C1]